MRISEYLERQLRFDFLRNVVTLFTGSSIAQLIPFLVSPVLTRLYVPEEFGSLGLLISIASYFSIVATLQYSTAIMLPKKDEDAINVFGLAILVTFGITALSLLVVLFLKDFIVKSLSAQEVESWLIYIPVIVSLTGIFESLNVWSSRQKRFRSLAFRHVSQATTQTGTKLLLGLKGFTSIGLLVGTIAGQFIATSVLFFQSLSLDRQLYKSIRFIEIKKQARLYIDFPKYTTWQGFFDIFNVSGMALLINLHHGTAMLGMYTFSLAMVQKPINLIGQSISEVYYQQVSEIHQNNASVWSSTEKLLRRVFFLGLPFACIGILFAPLIFNFVFGEEWKEAGVFAQIFTPWVFAKFVTYPLSKIPPIFGRQKQFFLFSLIVNFGPLSVFFLLSFLEVSLYPKLISYFGLMLFCMIGLYFWIRRLALKAKNQTQPVH